MHEFWDDPARDFRQRYQVPEHFLWHQHDLPMIDYLGYVQVAFELLPNPPCSLLDVGCGDGWVAREAIKRSYTVVGIDYSDRAIGFARLMAPQADFQVGDVRALANNDNWRNKFEAALFIEVLEHIPPEYHQNALIAIRQCLIDAGALVMTVPSVNMKIHHWHYKHFSQQEGRQLLEQAGFEVQNVVNQHVLSFIASKSFWRLIRNRFYDLRIARVALSRILLERYNTTYNPQKAGRYIYKAVKKS